VPLSRGRFFAPLVDARWITATGQRWKLSWLYVLTLVGVFLALAGLIQ
jgi:hypothetical protein